MLLGPSGCGKTTTLRIIAGFTPPSVGRVLIGGEDVTAVAPRRRRIGMVFQNYALFPNMTVAENVAFGLRQQRVPRAAIQARVAELLALVRLSDRGDDGIHGLSGGQQQRVALARALAVAPRVLLMDEPFGALDLKLREAMQIELRRIQRDFAITTVLVTHDQHEAMNLADRIVVMDRGRIQQVATPEQIYARPANRFVAGFVGQNNLLDGCVTRVTDGRAEVELAGARVVVDAAGAVVTPGDAVAVAIRPEDLSLVPDGGAGHAALAGEIAMRRFAGSLTHYGVQLGAGTVLLVERPSSDAPLAPGDRVRVGWDAAKAVLLAAGG